VNGWRYEGLIPHRREKLPCGVAIREAEMEKQANMNDFYWF
jgi:hypothetical protein